MAKISDLSFKHRLFMRTYSIRKLDPVPWTALPKPLEECNVALVTTAAYYLPEAHPGADPHAGAFDERIKGGDASYRVIALREADGSVSPHLRDLEIGHRSTAFSAEGIAADYNLALPADRFVELEAEGAIGRLHPRALSFMGSITAPGRLSKQTAPEASEFLRAEGVDVAFLTPV